MVKCGRKCARRGLVPATNDTRRFQYYWCVLHRCVLKDEDRDGLLFGVRIKKVRK